MSSRKQDTAPLVKCVERLTEARYVVLGPENAEGAATLLGILAFGSSVDERVRARAIDVLAAFPDRFSLVSSLEADPAREQGYEKLVDADTFGRGLHDQGGVE